MSSSVPRIGRILDVVSALLFLGGAVLYGWSWVGLRDQEAIAAASSSGAPSAGQGFSFAAVERVEDLNRIGDQGLILLALGAVFAVVAAVAARRVGSGSASP